MTVDVQFNVDQALAKLSELVAKHGPDAVNLAAQVVQVDAVGSLVCGGFSLLALAAAVAGGIKCVRGALASDYCEDLGWWVGALTSIFVGVLASIVALSTLLNVWNYVALFNPKLALAHEVLVRLTGGQ